MGGGRGCRTTPLLALPAIPRLEHGRGPGALQPGSRRRIAAQPPLERKLAVADYVIDIDHDLTRTLNESDRVFRALVEEQAAGAGGFR